MTGRKQYCEVIKLAMTLRKCYVNIVIIHVSFNKKHFLAAMSRVYRVYRGTWPSPNLFACLDFYMFLALIPKISWELAISIGSAGGAKKDVGQNRPHSCPFSFFLIKKTWKSKTTWKRSTLTRPWAAINPDAQMIMHFGIVRMSLSDFNFLKIPTTASAQTTLRSGNIIFQTQPTSLMVRRNYIYIYMLLFVQLF